MQTYCPHCETHFRITKTQIDIADGHVRCGVCKEVFNIYEVAENTEVDNQQQTLLTDNDPDYTTNDTNQEQTDTQNSKQQEESDFTYQILPDSESTQLDDINNYKEAPKDFFDDEPDESLNQVIPEDLRSYKPPSMLATTLWSFGILFLTACLTFEYIWFNQKDFDQFPTLQAKIQYVCQKFNCVKKIRRDPEKIRLVTRNVYSHPNEKEALMINVVIKNMANFAQAYPVMQIDFSDIRGKAVAARRFHPFEYLATHFQDSETKHPHILQPDADASISLEIKDPGKDAMTYEFNFL